MRTEGEGRECEERGSGGEGSVRKGMGRVQAIRSFSKQKSNFPNNLEFRVLLTVCGCVPCKPKMAHAA